MTTSQEYNRILSSWTPQLNPGPNSVLIKVQPCSEIPALDAWHADVELRYRLGIAVRDANGECMRCGL